MSEPSESASGSERAILRLEDLYKSFGSLHVLRGINLGFERGKTTVVLGPSGSGKSVLLKLIVGLLRPDQGAVYFDGQRIDTLPERRLPEVRTEFGYLFQMGALFDSMTVEQNVCFPMLEHPDRVPGERAERCQTVLELVGMSGTEHKRPAELSGGQRKRVALARAIALHPRVILYDEPTTGLDPIRSDSINRLIMKLQHELQVTSIVVTHDMSSAYKIADRIVMLYDGRFVADGTPEQIRTSTDPWVRGFVEGRATEEAMAGLESASEEKRQ
jgi:phospholipid/cholesterol/gamma-HCH transport system ATP-binding protein